MSYSGDSSLSSDIRERILSTFEQALDLTDKGSRKEALLGCDFVLRLDPLFEPARVLHKRLRADESEIPTTDLRAALAGTPGEDLGLEAIEEAAADLEPGPDMSPPLAGASEAEAADFEPPAAAEPEPTTDDAADAPSFAERIEAELDASFGPRQVADPPLDDSASKSAAEPEAASDALMVEDQAVDPEPRAENAEEEAYIETPTYADAPEPVDAGFDAPTFDEVPPDRSGFNDMLADDSPLGPPAQLDPESERRIQELLDQGQQAFEQKEFQSAIDSWSRVFLIDIDHQEANQRIEDARRLAAEAERQVEEVFHEAMSRLDEGDLEASRLALQRVLNATEPSGRGRVSRSH